MTKEEELFGDSIAESTLASIEKSLNRPATGGLYKGGADYSGMGSGREEFIAAMLAGGDEE